MRKTGFLFTALLFFTIVLKAQTSDALIGKWKFKDIYNADKIDTASLAMLRAMFADVTMYFKANNHYKVVMMKKEEGKWSYDESTKKMMLVANKGTQSQLEIISATSTTLILSIAKNKSFVLERTTVAPEDEVEEAVARVDLMSATSKQISKKWYLVKREVPGRTAEQSKLVTELAEGAYFDFKPNYAYESQAFNLKAQGTWKFGPGNQSLLLTIENTTITWKIKSISENELVLLRGNTTETWTMNKEPFKK